MVPITEILVSSRGHYHELLMTQLSAQLEAAVDSDVLADLEVTSPAQHKELVLDLGLPAQMEGAGKMCREYATPE